MNEQQSITKQPVPAETEKGGNYTIDEKNLERQQLLAANLAPLTGRALQCIHLPQKDARILDIACGIGETSRLLAKHFAGAAITAMDIDNNLVQTAKSISVKENANIEFINADATNLPFEDNSFDLVFSRYLLMHVPDAVTILREMKRVCKPGGIVFAQEPDINASNSYPASWAYDKIKEYFLALFVDGLIGRKLPAYFNQIELQNTGSHADVVFEVNKNTVRRMYRLTAEALENALLAKKLATKNEHAAWVAELERIENDASTVVLTHPAIAVWGTK